MKSSRIVLGAVAVAAVSGLVLAHEARSNASPKASPGAAATAAAASVARVRLVSAHPATTAATESLTGTLVPAKALQVGFEVGGRLERVRVKKGEKVKAGQVLGELNTEMADAQVKAAEAAVLAAQAQAENAADVAARTERLKQSGSATEMQGTGATNQAKAAAAQLEAAKAQLAQARAARSRHELRAPFAGTVIDAPEQTGATVAPGTSLFTVEQLDPLILKITVPEASAGALQVGQKIEVQSVASAAKAQDATVRVIVPSADATTHRIPVELAIPNAEGRFVAHTLARGLVPLGSGEGAQAVPATSVALTGGDHVYTLENGAVQRVDVEVLARSEGEVVIRAAKPLAQVIDSPAEDLAVGARAEAR